MDQTAKRIKLQKEIEVLGRQNYLRLAILATAFVLLFYPVVEIAIQYLVNGKAWLSTLRSFSWWQVVFMTVFQFCIYYFLFPWFNKRALQRKRAELHQLEEASL